MPVRGFRVGAAPSGNRRREEHGTFVDLGV
jgi:hypothetical protein